MAATSVYRLLPAEFRARVADRRASGRRVLVSVVVPMYNVEEYLAECLDSILAQTHKRLEVIIVDDGSPDRSIDIAKEYASRDRRVRIVRQENAGLGAARNTGVEHAKGSMLCFVDSDDTVPPDAIEVMLRSLVQSGSDFAVGALVRDTVSGRHMPNWVKEVHATTRRRMTFADEPDVLKNVFAWTKLYRTEYFRRVVRAFPDGLYEDQIPAARAYLHGRFDILKDVVCYWRIRDDGTSITQQKSTMKDLVGRWNMLDDLAQEMKDAPLHLLRAWQVKTIGFDMRPYYEQVPRTSSDYWEFLHGRVRRFVDEIGYDLLSQVPVSDRLLAAATYHGHRDDVTELVCRRETRTWKVPGRIEAGSALVEPYYFDGLELEPDPVLRSLEVDAGVRAKIDMVDFLDDIVCVRGSAHLANVGVAPGDNVTVRLVAIGPDGEEHQVVAESSEDPQVDALARDPWNDHALAGFFAEVPLERLTARSYRLDVVVDVNGFSRRGPLHRPDHRGRGRLPVFGRLGPEGRWCIERQSDSTELVIRRIGAQRVPVHGAEFDGERVRFDLGRADGVVGTLRAAADGVLVLGELVMSNGRTWAEFDLSRRGLAPQSWVFSLERPGNRRQVRLSWAAPSAELRHSRAAVGLLSASQYGNVTLESGPFVAEIDKVDVVPAGLEVAGWLAADASLDGAAVACCLIADGVAANLVDVRPDGTGTFRCVVPLVDAHGVPLSVDTRLVLSMSVGDYVRVPRLGHALRRAMPVVLDGPTLRIEATATAAGAGLSVGLRQPFADAERGRRRQHELQVEYRRDARPLRDAVLFEAFNGRSVGDSPLALSRELHRQDPAVEQYWSVSDLRTPVPEWATPLLRFSRPWYELLATAGTLVNNNNWPWFFAKRAGQCYVQTWHGTPIKRIGNHVPSGGLTMTYRRLMEREARAWDVLLAQNEYAAKIFSEAFGYNGRVLIEGYPRNDSLVAGDAAATRSAVRARLGLTDADRVVLYAPTWRDNIRSGSAYGRVSYLDAAQLPPGMVVLYRGHANTAAASSDLPASVIDVTDHPDVNELMLASDLLVTDYSSIMFDYAVLLRPMYFLVPDLDQYSGSTRGFYRDFQTVAPGPLCGTTEELAEALADDYWSAYGDAHRAFVEEYAPLDDGEASARVVLRLTEINEQETQ
ncbi:bifunctional glycosyltransferase/CDP-glycerol:glycerophosphate glycerophosphotransferase [Isoptericola sp. G70]|uniref:bifunctional glycosyltransferase/CDP-glycerol:glycerophosphate glycerophosphotransferase n=1 Tax=Isoptericola sp. G70 TaxID=3376633 RepID=UPI003A80046E